MTTPSTLSSASGSAIASPATLGTGRAAPGAQHPLGEVAGDARSPRRPRARPSTPPSRPRRRGPSAPAAAPSASRVARRQDGVEAAGEHRVGDVVAARDAVEHGRDVGRLLVQARPQAGGVCVVSPVSHGERRYKASYAGTVTAAALTSPAAAARTVTTVRSDDAGALLDLLPAEGALSWVRRGEGLVGRGEAARLEVTGPHALAEAADWWAAYTDDLARRRRPRASPGPGRSSSPASRSTRSPGRRSSSSPRSPSGRRDGVGWVTTIGDVDPARAFRPRTPDDGPRPAAALRRRRPGPGHLVRRRRHRGRADRRRASWPRSSWPATCWSPPTRRSTRAGCCVGWPPASPTAGPSPSTACSAPPPSCCCGAPAGSCRRASSPGPPRGAPAPTTSAWPTALIGSAKDRAEHALAVDSLVRALEPYCTTARRTGRARAAHAGQRAAPGQRRHRHPAQPRAARARRPARADRRRAPHRGRLRHAHPRRRRGDRRARGHGPRPLRRAGGLAGRPGRRRVRPGPALRGADRTDDSARLFAGCGIVAGSDPAAELAETQSKFAAFQAALEG